MTCTGAPGDWYTIADFLGGGTGWNLMVMAGRAGLTAWSPKTCQGGFFEADVSECTRIATALAKLIVSDIEKCSKLGTRAAQRFEAGRIHRVEGFIMKGKTAYRSYMDASVWGVKAWAQMLISDRAFTTGMNLANMLAHEETHLDVYGGPAHVLFDNDEIWKTGDRCGGLPR